MEKLEKELETDHVPGDEESEVKKQHNRAPENWKKTQGALMDKKKRNLKDAMEQRNDVEIQLHILEETLEQKKEQDDKHQGQMGASPGSNPHREIMQEQLDKACQNHGDLFAANVGLKESVYELDGVADREKDPEKQFELRQVRGKVAGSHNKLLKELSFVKHKCTHARELQDDFGWQLLSLQVVRVFKLFWLGHQIN
ncbi:hypothetical protein BASA83_001518 [Batrachochytrium salamandrivorans]|nr:hypothetical protein BASA83_001518 [Batrachochytrium salamandrivorans]